MVGATIRTVRAQGVEHVSHRKQPAQLGDVVTGEPIRKSRTVPPLVVSPNAGQNRLEVVRTDMAQNLHTVFRVLPYA